MIKSTNISNVKRPGESVFGFLLLFFSIVAFYQAYKISGFTSLSSPGSIPIAATALMVITSCITVINNFTRPSEKRHIIKSFFIKVVPITVAIFCGLILIFAIVLETSGFILSAFFFLWISIWFLHKKGAIPAFVISLVSIIVVYLIFRLVFQVIVPEGIIPEREIMATIENYFSNGSN